jgi:hypothetical protein
MQRNCCCNEKIAELRNLLIYSCIRVCIFQTVKNSNLGLKTQAGLSKMNVPLSIIVEEYIISLDQLNFA